MRYILSVILAVLLAAQCLTAQQPDSNAAMKQNFDSLPPRAHVAVQLKNGSAITGRIANRGDSNFVIKPDTGEPQTIAYDQVSSVKQVKRHSNTKWYVIGIVGAAILVLAVVAVHIAHHPLGSGPL